MMKLKKVLKICGICTLIVAILLLSIVLIFVCKCIEDVKDMDIKLLSQDGSVCSVYDADLNKSQDIDIISSSYVTFEDIPKHTIDAFLSIEDKDFYSHDGINYKRMVSALIKNLSTLSFSQGASTITQQLVKNKFLTNEKTLSRKVKEIYLAKKLESIETKDSILEEYLNSIYYGSGAYGIGNASLRYFGKNANELDINESCVLAGVINSPSKYSPISNIENCKSRRNLILKQMKNDGKLTEKEYNENISKDIELDIHNISSIRGLDLYTKNVLNEASKILKLDTDEILRKNYKIYTYKDTEKQNILNETINNESYYQKNEYENVADSLGIILDNKTGGVVAIAGKSDYNLIDMCRQPGSLIKPILVYTPALEEKIIYQCSEILDERITIDGYSPQNVGNKYYGYVSIDECLGKSLNTPTIKLCNELGIEKCKEYGNRAGLKFSEKDSGLAIALGGLTNGFTIQNIAESYSPLSNDGKYKNSTYISKIISPSGITIYNRLMAESKYCKAETAYLMTETLINASHNGTSKKLGNLPYQVASKTGTVNKKDTNYNTDAYSLAYTSQHTMCMWLGNYTMSNEYNLSGNNNGGTYATSMVRDTFEKMYQESYPEDFTVPSGIIELPIDLISLEENHEIKLANNLPERYQKYVKFDINNVPPLSDIASQNETADIHLQDLENCIAISFDAKKYNKYMIYRIDSKDQKELIDTVSNFKGLYQYIDKRISFNEEYEYYLILENPVGEKLKSNTSTIILKKDYSKSILNQDNISWIFA